MGPGAPASLRTRTDMLLLISPRPIPAAPPGPVPATEGKISGVDDREARRCSLAPAVQATPPSSNDTALHGQPQKKIRRPYSLN
jgi:hypothetical protein